MSYTYTDAKNCIEKISNRFDFAQISTIGKTWCKRDIYSLSIGNGEKCVLFLSYSADRTGVSTQILLKFFERLCIAYKNDLKISAIKVRNILKEQKIVIIPITNPDCLEICNSNGKNALCYSGLVKRASNGSFEDWISNARGVEIDKNFPYKFKSENDILSPSPFGWCGPSPESENETKAIISFCKQLNPKHSITISPNGESISYVSAENLSDCAMMAQVFKSVCGFQTIKKQENSLAGSFDGWFSNNFDAPAFDFNLKATENNDFEFVYTQSEELLILSAIM